MAGSSTTNRDRAGIVRQFLPESVLISVGGGLLGIAFGFFLPWLIARAADWRSIATISSVAIPFGVSVMVGVVFGLYPAVKASRVDPIRGAAIPVAALWRSPDCRRDQ